MFAKDTFVAVALVALSPSPSCAQSYLGHSSEVRLQLDYQIADALLKNTLPAGWELDVATSGGAKDCNIRIQFVDRVAITGSDDRGQSTSQLIYFEVPVKKTGGDLSGRMVIGGLTTDPKDVPGPFGVYQLATSHSMERATRSDYGKPTMVTEDWDFTGAKGEHVTVHLKFERGAARKSGGDIKIFSAANPDNFQIVKNAQGLDPMRNVTVPARDPISEFSYSAGGGMLASLFDGKERVISIDAIQWNTRAMYRP
jgi:hypothetical protein